MSILILTEGCAWSQTKTPSFQIYGRKRKIKGIRKQAYQNPVQISTVFIGPFLLPTFYCCWKQTERCLPACQYAGGFDFGSYHHSPDSRHLISYELLKNPKYPPKNQVLPLKKVLEDSGSTLKSTLGNFASSSTGATGFIWKLDD